MRPNEAGRDPPTEYRAVAAGVAGERRRAPGIGVGSFRRTRLESWYRIRQRRSYASHPTSVYRDFENSACGSLFRY